MLDLLLQSTLGILEVKDHFQNCFKYCQSFVSSLRHFARVLVDLSMMQELKDRIIVEREAYTLTMRSVIDL